MAFIAPAQVKVDPSYTLPEKIMPYSQASGAFRLLASAAPLVRLGDGDQYVYIDRLDVRTKAAAGQSAYNQLPGVSIALSQISTPTYLFRVRAEYDLHDTAAAGRRGVAIDQAHRLGMRQAHFQLLRNSLLYGMNPANGEGLLNANGAVATSLPPDQNGNQTVVTYDNGAMAFFLLGVITSILTRTNQLGIPRHFTICGPQRTLGAFELANVVQLVQYQRPGAGSQTTAGLVKDVLESQGHSLSWAYDDTLIGKGSGSSDAIVITMPEVENPTADSTYNPNDFAELEPGLKACTMQLTDMAAPREITAPLPGGAVDIVSEMRATSGWAVRGEAVTLLSCVYQ